MALRGACELIQDGRNFGTLGTRSFLAARGLTAEG